MMPMLQCPDCGKWFLSMFDRSLEDAVVDPQQCPDCEPAKDFGEFE